MLPPGLEACPRCHRKIEVKPEDGETFSRSDLFWYSGVIVAIGALVLILLLAVAWICVNTLQ